MKLADFEAIVGRSDPRTVLVFETPLDVILPHIAVMAAELSAKVVRITPARSANSAPTDDNAVNALSESDYLNLEDIFMNAFNDGDWVVVDAMNAASYEAWRMVGQRLATVLPSSDFHLRKNFRLFTCAAKDKIGTCASTSQER